jgi:catechol 2,3-dioxygenase-like lactoylglutathione lyase family enzyme
VTWLAPLIAVRDVDASRRWYQRVFDFEAQPTGTDFQPLMLHGQLILRLHRWNVHEHPHLGNPESKPHGNGVLLWFEVDDFDATIERVRDANAEILEQPHVNPFARHRECWFRDLDGYVVVVSSRCGDAK